MGFQILTTCLNLTIMCCLQCQTLNALFVFVLGFQSFGLHSPDFSGSSSDLQHIAESFGLHSPDEISPDLCMALSNPEQLNTKGIYLDPDIIGKCLLSSKIVRSRYYW